MKINPQMEENTMKAEELRIGNFLDRNGLMEVVGIKIHAIKIYDHYNKIANPTWFQPEGFNGIPLTPEWLERLGYIRTQIIWRDSSVSNGVYSLKSDQYFIDFTTEGIAFCGTFGGAGYLSNYFIASLGYVHQLQNLYFALTGNELILK